MMKLDMNVTDSWLKKQFGTTLAFLGLWIIPSSLMTIISGFLSGSVITILLSLTALGLVGGLLYLTFATAGQGRKLERREFVMVKKALSYFAILQFFLHSVNLILAWSSSRIELPAYYVFYAMSVIAYGLYIPLFHSINNKENLKRLGLVQVQKKGAKRKLVPVKLFKGFWAEVFSWIDAILWTIVMVIFINSLIFQLYQIPTESMVPEHYVGSRVMAVKTLYNPEIPLSLVRLPVAAGFDRFDQLVLDNPRHEKPRDRALKEFFNNVLFMITFSAVQRDKIDVNGEIIVEPLIKRLIGMPGEQLMMVDDQVYTRASTGDSWTPLTADNDHAYSYITDIPVNEGRIQGARIEESDRREILRWDREKNGISDGYFDEMSMLIDDIASDAELLRQELVPGLAVPMLDFTFLAPGRSALRVPTVTEELLEAYAYAAAIDADFTELLREFAFPAEADSGSPYAESSQQANLLFKFKFAEALKGVLESALEGQDRHSELLRELNNYAQFYIGINWDRRNFAPFPEDGVLPEREYFFMGDNRYNSLDSRHWDEDRQVLQDLDPSDPYSLRYISYIDPFSISARDIRGKAIFGVF
jgi:signal peptidase I